VSFDYYSPRTNPRELDIHFTTGYCATYDAPNVTESITSVTIDVVIHPAPSDQNCRTISPKGHDVTILLKNPLAARTVKGTHQPEPVLLMTSPAESS
jgi:hypothetical protein